MKEWLKKRDDFKLSHPNEFLNLIRIDEGTHEELLNLVGPKFQKQDTQICNAISPNWSQSIILHFRARSKSFSDLKFLNAISERAFGRIVTEICVEINKILKYNIKAN